MMIHARNVLSISDRIQFQIISIIVASGQMTHNMSMTYQTADKGFQSYSKHKKHSHWEEPAPCPGGRAAPTFGTQCASHGFMTGGAK